MLSTAELLVYHYCESNVISTSLFTDWWYWQVSGGPDAVHGELHTAYKASTGYHWGEYDDDDEADIGSVDRVASDRDYGDNLCDDVLVVCSALAPTAGSLAAVNTDAARCLCSSSHKTDPLTGHCAVIKSLWN